MSFRSRDLRVAGIRPPDLARRHFLQGLAMGGAMAGIGLSPIPALGKTTESTGPETLRGTDFRLDIGREPVNFTGSPAVATAINGSVPAPILRWREGDRVTLNVTNRLPASSSIHWHGIILPARMDGVPGISFDGISPGQSFTYQFSVGQTGTYWYHSHSGFQEQTGMYGAIVIDPRGRDPYGAERDYVVVLSDWTDEDPQRVYAKLKKLSHYYNRNERTVGELMRDIGEKGIKGTLYGPPRDARGKSLISRRKRCGHISGIGSGIMLVIDPRALMEFACLAVLNQALSLSASWLWPLPGFRQGGRAFHAITVNFTLSNSWCRNSVSAPLRAG